MNKRIQHLHNEGLKWANTHKLAERNLVEVFIADQEEKIWEHFDRRNMFLYSIDFLGISEANTQTLIHLANRAKQVPAFRKAIAENKISFSKAARIAAHVESNESLIEFAAKHSKREIEREVAKLNPEGEPVNKVKHISENKVQVTVTISIDALEALERSQSLLAQKNLPATRNLSKSEAKESCPGKITQNLYGPLTAAQKHAVFLRDQGRCTHLDHEGKRCNSDRWVQVHHIIEREFGGTNELENLTIHCGFHHRKWHNDKALEEFMQRH